MEFIKKYTKHWALITKGILSILLCYYLIQLDILLVDESLKVNHAKISLVLLIFFILLVAYRYYHLNKKHVAEKVAIEEKFKLKMSEHLRQLEEEKHQEELARQEAEENKRNKHYELNSFIEKLEVDKKSIEIILKEISNKLNACQGVFYSQKKSKLELAATFAVLSVNKPPVFEIGEGLIGQVAKEKKIVNINNVPDGYINILSGLGNASPSSLIIVPVLVGEKLAGIIELASFNSFSSEDEELLSNISQQIATKIFANNPESLFFAEEE